MPEQNGNKSMEDSYLEYIHSKKFYKSDLDSWYPIKTGVVALIDFLGVGKYDLDRSGAFLYYRDNVISEIDFVREFGPDNHPYFKSKNRFKSYSFGDTILFTWELAQGEDKNVLLDEISSVLSHLFINCLKAKMLFRGAVSFGKWRERDDRINPGEKPIDKFCIIGPAISDCAKWYEEIDWAGVVFTPKTGKGIAEYKKYCDTNGIKTTELYYVSYSTPRNKNCTLKKKTYRLWTLNWPRDVFHDSNIIRFTNLSADWLAYAHNLINIFKRYPRKAKSKYDNIHKYIDHCYNELHKTYPLLYL